MGNDIDLSMFLKPLILYKVVVSVLIFNIADSIITLIGLQVGLVEANVFSDFSILFLTYKYGIWLLLFPLIYVFSRRKSELGMFTLTLISSAGLGMYIFVVTWNIIHVLGVVV